MVLHKGDGGLGAFHNVFLHISATCNRGLGFKGALHAFLHFNFFTHHDVRAHPHGEANYESKHYLAKEFSFLTHAFLVVLEHLDVVVGKTKRTAPEGAHKKKDHVDVGEVAPEERAGEDGEDYDDASHGGGAFLLDLSFQAKVTDGFADLLFLEKADNLLSGYHGNQHCGNRRSHCAETQEVHKAHSGEVDPCAFKVFQKVVYHYYCMRSLKVSVTISFSSK